MPVNSFQSWRGVWDVVFASLVQRFSRSMCITLRYAHRRRRLFLCLILVSYKLRVTISSRRMMLVYLQTFETGLAHTVFLEFPYLNILQTCICRLWPDHMCTRCLPPQWYCPVRYIHVHSFVKSSDKFGKPSNTTVISYIGFHVNTQRFPSAHPKMPLSARYSIGPRSHSTMPCATRAPSIYTSYI